MKGLKARRTEQATKEKRSMNQAREERSKKVNQYSLMTQLMLMNLPTVTEQVKEEEIPISQSTSVIGGE